MRRFLAACMLLLLVGCEKAKDLYDTAQLEEKQFNKTHATKLYRQIGELARLPVSLRPVGTLLNMVKPFFPGAIEYSGRMSAGYNSGRALSQETAATWTSIVAPFIRQGTTTRILDLGAGTGRFAELFPRVFQAQVIGVEPSTAMLAAADRSAERKLIAYVAGSAEAIPLRGQSCDLAWLSQVWHHIRDHHACARELHRIVSPGGYVLVRGAFGDQLDGFPTLFHFWPGTREICSQVPTIEHTVEVFEANGFVFRQHRRVNQATAPSLREFAERTRFRADTSLALISDSEFEEGQAAIEMAAALEHVAGPVVERIELLVFRPATPPLPKQEL